jgi:hypothetical protein
MIDKEKLITALDIAKGYCEIEDIYMLADILNIPRPCIGDNIQKYAFKIHMTIIKLQLEGKVK